MKTTLLILAALVVFANLASANPACVTNGSLSTYISVFATAGTACQISDKYFWGFKLADGPTPGGGEPTADQITVLPVPGLANVGIEFTGAWIVSGSQIMDSIISYHVATISGTAAIEDATLRITGTLGKSGSAAATEILDGVPGSPLRASMPSTSSAHIDFTLSPFSTFRVSDEIKVVGGARFGDIAHISVIQNDFSQIVPEPYAAVLIGSGLLAFGLFRRRQSRR